MSKKIWYAPNGMEAYGEDEIKAVEVCLRDGWLAGFGKYTIEFEEKVAAYFGKKYGLFVNSGSSANILALCALELPKGSEVLTPACTFSTTVAPILQLGLKPKFIDVEVNTYVSSVDSVLSSITSETKVIMLPNLVGHKPNWRAIREGINAMGRNDIILLEDSADTMTYTPDTDVSITSFYSSHVITACGSGGMVMFNDKKYLQVATMYRDWGRIGNNIEDVSERFNYQVDGIPYDFKFLYGCLGYNFKSSEVNAAFGLVQLRKLPKFLEIRRKNVETYLSELKDVKGVLLPKENEKTDWLAFPIQVEDRLGLVKHLEDNNIQTRVIFSGNITRHPAYREYLQEYKNADTIMKNGLLLGCHHGMTTEDVKYVCNKIKEFLLLQNDS